MGESISNHISDKTLVSEYIKNSKFKKTNNPIKRQRIRIAIPPKNICNWTVSMGTDA